MTREEAKEKLYMEWQKFLEDNIDYAGISEAYKMAFKALEQEPCEDAISRNELLKAIDTWDKFGCDANTKLVSYQDHYIPYIHYDDVVKCIKGMPPVTPQPKTGYWIEQDNGNMLSYYRYKCSVCGGKRTGETGDWIQIHDSKWKYCPDCGAKMIDPQERSDKE